MDREAFRQRTRSQIFAITRCIYQGPFASLKREPNLVAEGVTHVLNVGESPSILRAGPGSFREIAFHPIPDFARMPDDFVLPCLDTLHRMVCEPGSNVYVHCVAGQNRSPTIVWLYLVACGLDPSAAKEVIASRTLDAVPGHAELVDDALVDLVERHGAVAFRPHPRPEALEPA